MRDVWEDRRKVKEEEYFKKQNEAALAALKARPSASAAAAPLERRSGMLARLRAAVGRLLRRFFNHPLQG